MRGFSGVQLTKRTSITRPATTPNTNSKSAPGIRTSMANNSSLVARAMRASTDLRFFETNTSSRSSNSVNRPVCHAVGVAGYFCYANRVVLGLGVTLDGETFAD